MCGTCKYCLGFFQAAGGTSGIMLLTSTSLMLIFGGMPPMYTMIIGFWIQYTIGCLSIYLAIYLVRVVGTGHFTNWTSKYCFTLMVIIIVFYSVAAILFFIPATESRMLTYSRRFKREHNKIPEFLDSFQSKYACCGINNYTDYNDPNRLGLKDLNKTIVIENIEKTDPKYYLVKGSSLSNFYSNSTNQLPTLVKERTIYSFDVPQSCCVVNKNKEKNCGQRVEFGNDKERNENSAEKKINDWKQGCLDKYQTIMNGPVSSKLQLPWLIGILRWGSLIQAVQWFILIWVYRLTLKGLKRDATGKLVLLGTTPGESGVIVGGTGKKKFRGTAHEIKLKSIAKRAFFRSRTDSVQSTASVFNNPLMDQPSNHSILTLSNTPEPPMNGMEKSKVKPVKDKKETKASTHKIGKK